MIGCVTGNCAQSLDSKVKKEDEFWAPKMVPMGIIRNSQNTAAKMMLASGRNRTRWKAT
jgi:hypothetical protein